MTTDTATLLAEADRKLRCFLATGCRGFFIQAYDRLLVAGLDVEALAEPTRTNAHKLVNLVAVHAADVEPPLPDGDVIDAEPA